MTAGTPPPVSVIVPVFNGARFLRDAVASIRAQNVAGLEIVVVDDGSTDGSAEIAGTLGLYALVQENRGPAAARNTGVLAARSPVLAFLDVDDLWAPGWLGAALPRLLAEPDVVVLGRTRVSLDPGSERDTAVPQAPVVALVPGAAILTRRTFDRVGGFDPSLRFGEDLAFFLAARELDHPVLVLEDTCLLYRLHGRNSVTGRNARDLNVLRVLHASLARRAAGAGGARADLPALRHSGPAPTPDSR